MAGEAPSDAPAPKKRPMNAYMVFYKQELGQQQYEGMRLTDRAKKIGEVWRAMDDRARAPFHQMAAEATTLASVASA